MFIEKLLKLIIIEDKSLFPSDLKINHKTTTKKKPISKTMREIITGELLSDAFSKFTTLKIGTPAITDADLEIYYEAVMTLRKLRELKQVDKSNLDHFINLFNEAIDLVIQTPVASIGLKMALAGEKWVQHVCSQYIQEGYSSKTFNKEYYVNYRDEMVPSSFLYTCSSVQLYVEYYRWHKSGAKQVPHDIPMTPTVFLHWHAAWQE